MTDSRYRVYELKGDLVKRRKSFESQLQRALGPSLSANAHVALIDVLALSSGRTLRLVEVKHESAGVDRLRVERLSMAHATSDDDWRLDWALTLGLYAARDRAAATGVPMCPNAWLEKATRRRVSHAYRIAGA